MQDSPDDNLIIGKAKLLFWMANVAKELSEKSNVNTLYVNILHNADEPKKLQIMSSVLTKKTATFVVHI